MIHVFALTVPEAAAWGTLIASITGAILSIINALKQGRTTKEVAKVTEKVEAVQEVKNLITKSVERRDEKLAEIHEDLKANTEVSREAFKEANGVNAKLVTLHESTLAAAEAAKASTQKIE